MTVKEYLQNTFHIDDAWFKTHQIPKRDLVAISKVDAVKKRMDFDMAFFNIPPEKLGVMIKQDVEVLSLEPRNIESKVAGYAKLLCVSMASAKKLIVNSPKLLHDDVESLSKTSVKAKIKFYKKHLNASDADVAKMIIACPTILDLDIVSNTSTSVKTKLKYLKQFATEEQIVANPKLLTFPARKLKIRFLIMSQAFSNKKILQGQNLMTNENTMWARYCFIDQLENKNFNFVTSSKSNFENKFAVKDSMLIKKYPITKTVVKKLEKDYLKKSNSILKLDKKEMEDVLGLGV